MLLPRYYPLDVIEAGCDETGRGCLAGSVFAAAVILPPGYDNPRLDDSKKLTLTERLALRREIECDAVAFAVAECTPAEIDRINILHASFLAMHRALDALKVRPTALLIDGNRFDKYRDIPHTTIVKGDGKYQSIAAASILAKTYRDEYMEQLSVLYPQYGWDSNKGYPTQNHKKAVLQYGRTKHHRRTFHMKEEEPLLPFVQRRVD